MKAGIDTGRLAVFMKRLGRSKVLLLMALPVILQKFIFAYIPMSGLAIAFRKFSFNNPIFGEGSLSLNYFRMFFVDNPDAWNIVRNTVLLNVYNLLFGFPVTIILTLLFVEVRNKGFKKLVQTASYVPNFISTVALCGMLSLMLMPDSGIVNKIITALGGQSISFLTQPQWFRTVFIASNIWQGTGWGTIIYLAAIAGIDRQLYEATYIDGGGRFKQMFHVTLPGIKNVAVIMLLFQMGSMFYSATEKVLMLYNAMTYSSADVLGTYIYRVGLLQGSTDPSFMSMGASIGMFNSVISLLLVIAANAAARKWSEVSLW